MTPITLELPDLAAMDLNDPQQRRKLGRALQQLTDQLNLTLQNLGSENFDAPTRTLLQRLDTDTQEAQAALEMTGERIASRVSRRDYNGETVASLINQSADEVRIAANHLSLEGHTTINGGFSVDTAGSMHAVSGTVGGWELGENTLHGKDIGLVSEGEGVRLYAGSTPEEKATAPFRVYGDGSVVAEALQMTGGDVVLTAPNSTVPKVTVKNSTGEEQMGITARGVRQVRVGEDGTERAAFWLLGIGNTGSLQVHDAQSNTQAVFSGLQVVHPTLSQTLRDAPANLGIDDAGEFYRSSTPAGGDGGNKVIYSGAVTAQGDVTFATPLRGFYTLQYIPEESFAGGDICCYLNGVTVGYRCAYTYASTTSVYGSDTHPIVCYRNRAGYSAAFSGRMWARDGLLVVEGIDLRGTVTANIGSSVLSIDGDAITSIRFSQAGRLHILQLSET